MSRQKEIDVNEIGISGEEAERMFKEVATQSINNTNIELSSFIDTNLLAEEYKHRTIQQRITVKYDENDKPYFTPDRTKKPLQNVEGSLVVMMALNQVQALSIHIGYIEKCMQAIGSGISPDIKEKTLKAVHDDMIDSMEQRIQKTSKKTEINKFEKETGKKDSLEFLYRNLVLKKRSLDQHFTNVMYKLNAMTDQHGYALGAKITENASGGAREYTQAVNNCGTAALEVLKGISACISVVPKSVNLLMRNPDTFVGGVIAGVTEPLNTLSFEKIFNARQHQLKSDMLGSPFKVAAAELYLNANDDEQKVAFLNILKFNQDKTTQQLIDQKDKQIQQKLCDIKSKALDLNSKFHDTLTQLYSINNDSMFKTNLTKLIAQKEGWLEKHKKFAGADHASYKKAVTSMLYSDNDIIRSKNALDNKQKKAFKQALINTETQEIQYKSSQYAEFKTQLQQAIKCTKLRITLHGANEIPKNLLEEQSNLEMIQKKAQAETLTSKDIDIALAKINIPLSAKETSLTLPFQQDKFNDQYDRTVKDLKILKTIQEKGGYLIPCDKLQILEIQNPELKEEYQSFNKALQNLVEIEGAKTAVLHEELERFSKRDHKDETTENKIKILSEAILQQSLESQKVSNITKVVLQDKGTLLAKEDVEYIFKKIDDNNKQLSTILWTHDKSLQENVQKVKEDARNMLMQIDGYQFRMLAAVTNNLIGGTVETIGYVGGKVIGSVVKGAAQVLSK